ncbi:MAG TPA: ECF transporter S component [Tissierellaceae bacterium]|nr:ECF transporter S component [Tissierellaceae bacterium]
MYTLSRETWSTRNMVKIAVLGVIGMVLMFFDIPAFFAPGFLKIDLADLPALIGAFAMGPMAGVIVQLVKNLLSIFIEGTKTGGIGELSNFIVGSTFVYVAGLVYYKNKTFRTAVIGLIVGILAMTTVATISNYYVIFPLYAKIFGWPMDQIIQMGSAVNKFVIDYKTLILFAVVPFNLVKGTIVSIVTLLVYKKVSPILHK